MNEDQLNTICILAIFFSPLLLFVIYCCYKNRCPNGGFHKWNREYGRHVRGNDIGFGITNSFTYVTDKCEKCGLEHETFE